MLPEGPWARAASILKRLVCLAMCVSMSTATLAGCALPWQVPEEATGTDLLSQGLDTAAGTTAEGGAMLGAGGAGAEGEEAAEDGMAPVRQLPDASWAQPLYHDDGVGADYGFATSETYLEIYDGDAFREVYLNGVNIGSGYPGYFPGELAIPAEVYYHWFEQISQMHCNVIRIYTTMMPDFYDALYEYNRVSEEKLYLLMGVWYDETTMIATGDAYDLLEDAIGEAQEQIGIIHGDCVIEERAGRAYGTYASDVSPYVMGWILGIESDAYLVGTTNEKHPDVTSYAGEYLYTEGSDVQAFDAFLCELGDAAISYEMERYGMQRPISWANWPTADVMTHPDEPSYEVEDAITISVERFKARESFAPGIFASYHIYPYYPEFLILEDTYTQYVDENGDIDPYEAYLRQLRDTHTVPIVVAEYGLPASRGCTHVNPYTHLDQGHLTEQEQGEGLSSLATNIYENGYAGGIVFTWQDEWFKRTWNTMEYSDAERRPYWSDIQTSEQNFGLLSFDPGEEELLIKIDGKREDWTQDMVLSIEGGTVGVNGVTGDVPQDALTLYVAKDERYLYLALAAEGMDPATERLLLPIDVTQASGSRSYGDVALDRAADFVIDLQGPEDSHIYVQSYYDRYAFLYDGIDNLLDTTGYAVKDSARFNPIYLSLNKQLYIPSTGEVLDAMRYETGALRYGCADPEAADYDSLADFSYGDGFVEMRIAWGLLNFRDPSSKEVEADFWEEEDLTAAYIDEIYIGAVRGDVQLPMTGYSWEDWDTVHFHERLKASYGILAECYAGLTLE